MNDEQEKIEKFFKEKELYFTDIYPCDNGDFEIIIEWGDWKHEHKYCDYLMTQLGYKLVSVSVTEDNDSDCYSATRYYHKQEKCAI